MGANSNRIVVRHPEMKDQVNRLREMHANVWQTMKVMFAVIKEIESRDDMKSEAFIKFTAFFELAQNDVMEPMLTFSSQNYKIISQVLKEINEIDN